MTGGANTRFGAALARAESADIHVPSFGSKSRVLRLQRGLTLEQLAAGTGLSKGHLSRFERGEKTLSIAALMRVSQALGTSVAALLGEGRSEAAYHLVRAGEGTPRAAPAEDGGYAYTALSRAGESGGLSTFLVELPAEGSRTGEVAHAGEEGFLVLTGRVEVDLEDETILLGPGDYLQFSGTLRHKVRSFEGASRILIVVAAG